MPRNKAWLFSICLVLSVCAGIQACANYRVVVPEPEPATDYNRKTMHVFFWGAVEQTTVAARCRSGAIEEVRARDNLGYDLIGVLTLGIWKPMDMEWKCGKAPVVEPDDF